MKGDLANTPPVGAKALLSQVDDAIARLRIAARVGDLTHDEDMAASDAETAIRRELSWLARERHLLVADERDTSSADSEMSSLIGILGRLYDSSATLHRSAVTIRSARAGRTLSKHELAINRIEREFADSFCRDAADWESQQYLRTELEECDEEIRECAEMAREKTDELLDEIVDVRDAAAALGNEHHDYWRLDARLKELRVAFDMWEETSRSYSALSDLCFSLSMRMILHRDLTRVDEAPVSELRLRHRWDAALKSAGHALALTPSGARRAACAAAEAELQCVISELEQLERSGGVEKFIRDQRQKQLEDFRISMSAAGTSRFKRILVRLRGYARAWRVSA